MYRFSGFFGGGSPSCDSEKEDDTPNDSKGKQPWVVTSGRTYSLTSTAMNERFPTFCQNWAGGFDKNEPLAEIEEATSTTTKKKRCQQFLVYIAIVAIFTLPIIIGLILFHMPRENDNAASSYVFSEERARVHLTEIAQRPHPFDSEDNERVANYIISYATSLQNRYGSDVVEIQTQNVTMDVNNEQADIVNVAILVKGTDHDNSNEEKNRGTAILVSCHYDGVSYGPAASDDGVSCATMLEMASVLSSSPTKLKRDVLFLFVDAEEVGLVGSTIFFEGESPHPWSLLPSVAINLDNRGICGKQVLEKANSAYAADAYFKYAVHPKAFSFTELYDIHLSDAVVYERNRLHTISLGCWSGGWAHHSSYDDIEHVSRGSLHLMGENVLAIIKGVAAEQSFPSRLQPKETDEKEVSGLFYFTILGNHVFYVPVGSAAVVFPVIAVAFALTMPSIVHFTKNEDQSRIGKAALRTIWIQFIFANLNFILGFGACIIAFAGCCLWKEPTEDQLASKADAGDTANLAWNDLSSLPTTLSLFAILCTSILMYSLQRKMKIRELSEGSDKKHSCRICCRSKTDEHIGDEQGFDDKDNTKASDDEEDEDEEEEESLVTIESMDVPDEVNALETSVSKEVSVLGVYGAEGPPQSIIDGIRDDASEEESSSSSDCKRRRNSQTLLQQLGKDVYVGVFYFYTLFLFILSIAMKDAVIFVLWQSVFMWLGAACEMLLSWYKKVNEKWLLITRAFVSTVPALFFLSSSLYWVLSEFWNFPNEIESFWYGAPAVDALCIGLVVPLLIPHLVMVSKKTYRIIGFVSAILFIATASICIIVSMESPRFEF